MKKIVLFGAGKIGRSFIGQLFSRSGYEVVFIDIAREIVRELNKHREYKVVVKSTEPDQVIRVRNVRALHFSQTGFVAKEISDCDIIAVSVGQKGLPDAVSLISVGLRERYRLFGCRTVDIILAENIRNAAGIVHELLEKTATGNFSPADMVGLIETSIGKMVPIMPEKVQEKDRLLVYAEPYNILIMDRKAFKNPLPRVWGLDPKENIRAYVDRKAYIHNTGHVAAAYYGFYTDPTARYLPDVLQMKDVREFTRNVMLQSADILMAKYPGEFTGQELIDHINDLLTRFENKELGDTIFRVGCDLRRKLHRSDRILSPARDGIRMGLPVDLLVEVFVYGLRFRQKDEKNNVFPGDAEILDALNSLGLERFLVEECELDKTQDAGLIDSIIHGEELLTKSTDHE